jgi:hypothetical protein
MTTLERSFSLVAVRKDASGAAASEQATGPKVYKFRANDGEYDRYNDRLSVKGWKLDNYNANPIILFNHMDGAPDWWTGTPAAAVLPIGKGRAYVEGDALMVDIEFDQDDPFAKAVESKVDKGILSAVSVRYRMTEGKYRENEKHGYDSDEQELYEISIVNIPGNQRAVRVKSAADERAAIVGDIAKAVVALLDERERTKSETGVDGEGAITHPAAAPEPEPAPEPAPETPTELPEELRSLFADAVLKSLKEKMAWS